MSPILPFQPATILEKLYNNDLNFNDACNKLSNLLLKETNEKIYKEFINIVSEEDLIRERMQIVMSEYPQRILTLK